MRDGKILTDHDLFHLFDVECRGDTLILAPRGDATAVPEAQFRLAIRRVHDRFNGCGARNLVVDLSVSNYPGISILGAVADLVVAVRRHGGIAAVAGASPDTDRVLQEYGLGGDWTVFPDRPTAVKRIARESWPELARRRRTILAACAALLALSTLGAAAYLGLRMSEASAYREIAAVWREYQRIVQLPPGKERYRATTLLKERAFSLRDKLEARELWKPYRAARELALIVGSNKYPDPRAEHFEEFFLTNVPKQRITRVSLLNSRNRQLQSSE